MLYYYLHSMNESEEVTPDELLLQAAFRRLAADKKLYPAVEEDVKIYQHRLKGRRPIYVKFAAQQSLVALAHKLDTRQKQHKRTLKIIQSFNLSDIHAPRIYFSSETQTLKTQYLFKGQTFPNFPLDSLVHILASMLETFEQCLLQIYASQQVNLNSSNYDSPFRFLGDGRKRIGYLKAFILKHIESRPAYYSVKPLEVKYECPLISSRPEDMLQMSEENEAKISRIAELTIKKLIASKSESPLILRRIQLNQFNEDKSWSHQTTFSSTLKKIYLTYKITDLSLNSECNKQLQVKRQEVVTGNLVMKSPTQEGLSSYQSEWNTLKFLRLSTSPFIGRYFAEPTQENNYPERLFVQHYERNFNPENLKESEKLALMKDIALGIAFLHSRKVIHRDLKPDNIMIDRKSGPKIIDFGSSCILDRKAQLLYPPSRLMTTPRYNVFYSQLPRPLQDFIDIGGYERHQYFDLYSFGIILFDMMRLNNLGSQGGEKEYVWENLRWIVQHTALLNPNERVCPQMLAILLMELLLYFESVVE